jgi:hypothetical protein
MRVSTGIIAGDHVNRARYSVRAGWNKASKHVAVSGNDALVMPEFANEADTELKWECKEDEA